MRGRMSRPSHLTKPPELRRGGLREQCGRYAVWVRGEPHGDVAREMLHGDVAREMLHRDVARGAATEEVRIHT